MTARPAIVGVSLKAYLTAARTTSWAHGVAQLAVTHPAVQNGAVDLFVLPPAPLLVPVRDLLQPAGVTVGAQSVSAHPPGPFTGDVPAELLAELGIRLACVGHAERRRLHGESDTDVAEQVQRLDAAGLTALVCVGEAAPGRPDAAIELCSAQVRAALALARPRVIVAYEPVWAIGAEHPAPADHVTAVCAALRSIDGVDSVVYGGAAGPGTLASFGDGVDGLFLGRYAHDLDGLRAVLDDVEPVRKD